MKMLKTAILALFIFAIALPGCTSLQTPPNDKTQTKLSTTQRLVALTQALTAMNATIITVGESVELIDMTLEQTQEVYCRLPEHLRLSFREFVAAKARTDNIKIECIAPD